MSGLGCVHLIGREVWLWRETLVSELSLMRVGTLRFAHPSVPGMGLNLLPERR